MVLDKRRQERGVTLFQRNDFTFQNTVRRRSNEVSKVTVKRILLQILGITLGFLSTQRKDGGVTKVE